MNKKVSYIDVKCTIWQRIKFMNDDDNYSLDKMIELYNKIGLVGQIPNELPDDVIWEDLFDTNEEITPLENNGCSTVEMYDEDDNMLWDNSNKQ